MMLNVFVNIDLYSYSFVLKYEPSQIWIYYGIFNRNFSDFIIIKFYLLVLKVIIIFKINKINILKSLDNFQFLFISDIYHIIQDLSTKSNFGFSKSFFLVNYIILRSFLDVHRIFYWLNRVLLRVLIWKYV